MNARIALFIAWMLAVQTALAASPESSNFSIPRKMDQSWELETKEGFSTQFWLTDNLQFFFSWNTGDYRTLSRIDKAQRTKPFYLALFFANPGTKVITSPKNPSKSIVGSIVTFDYDVLRPNGTIYGSGKNITAWAGPPPPAHMVQLAAGRLTITFELIDPPGDYTIRLIVRDNIRKVEIPLQRKVTLVED